MINPILQALTMSQNLYQVSMGVPKSSVLPKSVLPPKEAVKIIPPKSSLLPNASAILPNNLLQMIQHHHPSLLLYHKKEGVDRYRQMLHRLHLIAEAPPHHHPLGLVHVGECPVTPNFLLHLQRLLSKLPKLPPQQALAAAFGIQPELGQYPLVDIIMLRMNILLTTSTTTGNIVSLLVPTLTSGISFLIP